MVRWTQASCVCGFFSFMEIGEGPEPFGSVCEVPALCKACGEFFLGNYYQEIVLCPKCHKRAYFYDHPSLRDNDEIQGNVLTYMLANKKFFRLGNNNYLCPGCNQMSLKFQNIRRVRRK